MKITHNNQNTKKAQKAIAAWESLQKEIQSQHPFKISENLNLDLSRNYS